MNASIKHALGLSAAVAIAVASHLATAPASVARMRQGAAQALAHAGGQDVAADFTSVFGLLTRHPRLSTRRAFTPLQRLELARVVARVAGVGGVRWASAPGLRVEGASDGLAPDHCQKDVEGLLRVRTIRFDEGQASLDAASLPLVDDVADALRPCAGSRIATEGHTDPVGDDATNQALSLRRAEAVRARLVGKALIAADLVAIGFGATRPVDGLDPADPANRRIEFRVIAVAPVRPTPIDTPEAR